MRDCVGVANSSSPRENSARHTFQDRAYLGGRIVRKRTKKSGIIYCLVTSHPPRRGEGNKQADSRLPNPLFLVPGRGGRIRGNSGFPGPDPRFPQTRPIRGLGRKRPNSSLENRSIFPSREGRFPSWRGRIRSKRGYFGVKFPLVFGALCRLV